MKLTTAQSFWPKQLVTRSTTTKTPIARLLSMRIEVMRAVQQQHITEPPPPLLYTSENELHASDNMYQNIKYFLSSVSHLKSMVSTQSTKWD
ncbi:hypothetical protein Tcan_01899 [Toxocara canis]|uniref:Uncharacterized protein n=1 Tax=Toxocara canis TaxID=6265 RepID=A0A0B2UVU3_TOXCA|nr:hypothetical protein Tcan_01899 [Toxocara canis]